MDINAELDQPYACSAPGCTQCFPTEDHLMIHRHKHDMSMKFPSIKKDSILPDQTPTPTRFLRSCEEVGLFEQLDCCPETDEDTKQGSAVQNQNHGYMSNYANSPAHQQALPSPKASSIFAQETTTNQQVGPLSGLLSCMVYLRAQQRQPQPASRPDSAQSDPTLPDTTLPSSVSVHSSQIKSHGSSMGLRFIGSAWNHTGSSPQFLQSAAKQRLKAALRHLSGSVTNGNISTLGHMMQMNSPPQEQREQQHLPHTYQHHGHTHSNTQSHTQTQSGYNHPQRHTNQIHRTPPPRTPPHTPHHSGSRSQESAGAQLVQLGGRHRRGRDEDPNGWRQKFLERNRAAASRCRQKRKVWVISLEKKAEELSDTHLQLQNEVTLLKNEVTQLKQLLLAHRDCPVTIRQKEAHGYHSAESGPAGSSALSCSQPQLLQHNSVSTSTAAGGTSTHAPPPPHCSTPSKPALTPRRH